jgi:hypothetical protein
VNKSPSLIAVTLTDAPERWAALGFEVLGERVRLRGAQVVLGAREFAAAIEGVDELAGLALADDVASLPAVDTVHPNGALGIDHIVALTPEFERVAPALALKRVRDAGGFRQGFRRLGRGGTILELVEAREAPDTAWWGLTVTVADMAALPPGSITAPKPAVQPGRLIATATSPGTPLAFITPES